MRRSMPALGDSVEKGFREGSPSNIDSRPTWNAQERLKNIGITIVKVGVGSRRMD
jgi:hypothetical protein